MYLLKRRFRVIQGSLARGTELLLVTSSTTCCDMGHGDARAVSVACGLGFEQHVRRLLGQRFRGPMAPGQVLITDAGAHPTACHVAHVAVVDDREGIPLLHPGAPHRGARTGLPSGRRLPDMERIAECYESLWLAIERIDEIGDISVGLGALGAGVAELGVRLPTDLACRSLRDHLRRVRSSQIGDVTFYAYSLLELINMMEVVSTYFEVPPETVPRQVRRLVPRRHPS